jgi:hypothetical protein
MKTPLLMTRFLFAGLFVGAVSSTAFSQNGKGATVTITDGSLTTTDSKDQLKIEGPTIKTNNPVNNNPNSLDASGMTPVTIGSTGSKSGNDKPNTGSGISYSGTTQIQVTTGTVKDKASVTPTPPKN